MARSKGDLMRANGKKGAGRKSFPNLCGSNLSSDKINQEIHLQFRKITKNLKSYLKLKIG